MGEATVWAQAQDGRWERIGPDRVRGVWPEGLRATANDWGSDTASFLIRRDPGAVFPDLLPFTPIDVELGGERVWSGFIWEPPQQADERAIAVECRGWQYHTDDDLLDRLYVHDRLSEWVDSRSLFGADLTKLNAEGDVVVGDGVITLGQANGSEYNNDTMQAVTLDLGPGGLARRVTLDYTEFNLAGNAAFTVTVRGSQNPNPFPAGAGGDVINHTGGGGTIISGVYSASFAVPVRYVHIYLYWTAGGPGIAANDHILRVNAARVYGQTAYESGNASILKASDVAKDLLPFCPLLDQRTDLIQASAVSIPDFVLEENTARQGMDQANVVEGMQLRVTPERLLEYRPRPTVPILKTGAWARDALSGASRGSGEPIHNRVVVKGNDSSGGRVVVERWAGQQAGVTVERVSSPSFPNPSFDTNTTGWTAAGGATITRDTGTFESSPASGLMGSVIVPGTLATSLSGTFLRGVAYAIDFYAKFFGGSPTTARLGTATDFVEVPRITSSADPLVFVAKRIVWVPRADATGVTLTFTAGNEGVGSTYFDSFTVNIARPTVVDRRGFQRTRAIRVERPITTLIGTGMADASLKEAMRTPFKGDVSAMPSVVRTFLGDAPVHPAQLLRHTGELMHHGHLIDPDTGNLGRDSRIVQVAYDDEAVASAVSLDSTRSDFETQLARYEVAGT